MNFLKNKIAIGVIIIIAGIMLIFFCKQLVIRNGFSSERWKDIEPTERYKMVKDLENSIDLIGLTNTEIEDLLGERSMRYDPDGDLENDNYYWGYTIRYDNFEGEEELLVKFEENKVTKVEKEYLSYL